MNKKIFYIVMIAVLIFAIGGIIYHKVDETPSVNDEIVQEQENAINETKSDGEIVKISVDTVKGITPEQAIELCCQVMGEKDEETGFTFSFGVSGAVERDKKQYYVVRLSWLVNNSHLSYIGDLFVSADGNEIYDGVALPDEITMQKIIWSK